MATPPPYLPTRHSCLVLAILCPGQGAQTPGFLSPWVEDPTFERRLFWLSTVTGMDLHHFGTEADADAIRDTAVAQPLLVAAGTLAALSLFPHPAEGFTKISMVAGHSVGEITAAVGSGAISGEQGMVLVRERGRLMAEAAALGATGMTAILGGKAEDVLARIDELGLTPANNNGPGQIVAAGTMEQLAALSENPPERARVSPLQVAGAFHTHHMQPAVETLDRMAASVTTHELRIPIVSNRDGAQITSGREMLTRIVSQVSSPVRWDLCMQTMVQAGVTGVLELPPAGVLSGIAKRHMPGVEIFTLKTPDQLDSAREFIDRHALAPVLNDVTAHLGEPVEAARS